MSTILLVEDEELNRTLVKAVLSRSADPTVREAQVVDATSLSAARDRLAADHIDLILLDMNLPDGNGLTLASELAAVRQGAAGRLDEVLSAARARLAPIG